MQPETNEVLDIAVVQEKISGMQAMVSATLVTNDKQLEDVADIIKRVKTMGKFVRQEMEKYTKPAQDIINNARAKYLPYEKECDDAERILKSKASVYMTAREAERARKEASLVKRAESGQLKEETALNKMEQLGEEKKTVQTESGAKMTMRTVKQVEIVDPSQVPDEYWILDEVKIRKVALAGVAIPGVIIKETKSMSV